MRRWGVLSAMVLALAACQEQLAAPAECPQSCPGGNAVIVDTILSALPGVDSTYFGYVPPLSAGLILASNNLPALNARGILRFSPRPDSVSAGGAFRQYTVDSITLSIGIIDRDTAQRGLEVLLYRIPRRADSTFSFAQAIAAEGAGPVARLAVPDTLRSGAVRLTLTGAALAPLAIPAADSGGIAFSVGIAAPAPTGIRVQIGSVAGGVTSIQNYVRLIGVTDTTQRNQILSQTPEFGTWVGAARPAAPGQSLVIGGEPSSRGILRFRLPRAIRDSASIVRATLELLPSEPILGLRNQPTLLQLRPVLSDLGAKSPLDTRSVGQPIAPGVVDTVRIEVGSILQIWQQDTVRSQAFFLQVSPEAGTWSRLAFGNSQSTRPPRLRVTYLRPFRFQDP